MKCVGGDRKEALFAYLKYYSYVYLWELGKTTRILVGLPACRLKSEPGTPEH